MIVKSENFLNFHIFNTRSEFFGWTRQVGSAENTLIQINMSTS